MAEPEAAAPEIAPDVVSSTEPIIPAVAAATSVSEADADASSAAPSTPASTVVPGKTPSIIAADSSERKNAIARLDAFISHLHRALKTRGGHDVTLLFIAYVTRLTAAILNTLSRTALRHSARKLVALAFQLPPSATVILSSATPSPPLATLALQVSLRLRALVAMLAEWRTMNRMWGLVGMWMSAKELIENTFIKREVDEKGQIQPIDKFETTVAAAQIVSLTSYHLLEAMTWLSSKQVLTWSPKAQAKMSLYSVRSWAAYVFIDIGRLVVERSRKKRNGEATIAWREDWTKAMTMNLSWAPLTIHWGLPNGVLPETAVALFGLYPAVTLMKDLWRDTA